MGAILLPLAQRIADGDRFRIAGQRNDVAGAEGRLRRDDPAADVGEHDAVARRVEALVAAGVLDRLEGDAAHAFPLQREVDDLAQLVVVLAALHDHHQGGGNDSPFKGFQRLPADAGEVGAAQVLVDGGPQRIELQIDLEARLEGRQPLHEIRLLGDADAVGVEHDVADGPPLGRRDDLDDLRVDGRLAARELQEVGLAFAGDQRIHHALDLGQRAMRRRSAPNCRQSRPGR